MKPAGVETGWSAQTRGLVFAVCVFLLFMPSGLYTSRQPAQKSNSHQLVTVKGMNVPHPIPVLMAEAEDKYRNLLAKQSKILVEAVNEYRRRYGREPPRGFGDWWKFAVEHNAKLVDEYDGMNEDLEPFWELPGEELRRRAVQIGNFPTINLVRLRDGKAVLMNIEKGHSEDTSSAKGFLRLIVKFQSKLPDMDFPINVLDQSRVLVPWEHRHFPNATEQNSSDGIDGTLGEEFTPGWGGTGSVWAVFRRTCHPESQARRHFSSDQSISHGTNPGNHSDATDFASESDDGFHFRKTLDTNLISAIIRGHILIMAISSRIGGQYPHCTLYFRMAKHPAFQTYEFQAIIITIRPYSIPMLGMKSVMLSRNLTIWKFRGNTKTMRFSGEALQLEAVQHQPDLLPHTNVTGRFVRLASERPDTRKAIVFSDPPNSTSYREANVPIATLNDEIMDVAFTKWTGFDKYPGGEAAMRKTHRFAEPVPLGYNWKYKHLVDIDGMGYSARFLAFLASDSAVIKSTVYSEYFSDWIQPWLHYIPLSQGYHEIYNIFSFFSGPTESMLQAANSSALYDNSIVRKAEDGDRRLRRIAQAGKQWKQTVGRTIDMEVYVYRLCLEWGRLWADDRDSMNFPLPGLS